MSLFGHKTRKHKEVKKRQPSDNRKFYNRDTRLGPPLPPKHWIDGKLLFCVNPSVADYVKTSHDKQVAIPLNEVFEFESLLVKGKAICRAIDLASTDRKYFRGRSRKMDFTFQGQFKRKICFDRLYTGQVFDQPFTKLPGQFLIAGAIKVLKALAPSLKGDIHSKTPHMISPLASAAQVFQISRPGEEIPLPQEPQEDLSLLDAKFAKMKFTDRKSYFHNLDHLKEHHFVPGYVYTISCYTHMMSPTSYSVHILGMKWGIQQYLPSPMMIASVLLPPAASDDDQKQKQNKENSGNSKESEAIEMIQSEELECESKEDEYNGDYDDYDFKVEGDGDLSKCEFLFNFQVWHTKLVHELWPKQYKKK
eukprot:224831_1